MGVPSQFYGVALKGIIMMRFFRAFGERFGQRFPVLG